MPVREHRRAGRLVVQGSCRAAISPTTRHQMRSVEKALERLRRLFRTLRARAGPITRRDILGGVLHDYYRRAA